MDIEMSRQKYIAQLHHPPISSRTKPVLVDEIRMRVTRMVTRIIHVVLHSYSSAWQGQDEIYDLMVLVPDMDRDLQKAVVD